MTQAAEFRRRLRAAEPLLGCFVQIPHPHVVEVLAAGGLDCVCLDAEHGPWTQRDVDLGVLAARASGIASLVRLPSGRPHEILSALDAGATGVLVPHVRTADQARAIARACHYGPRGRGYVGGGRSSAYGPETIADRIARARRETTVIVQVEDAEALPDVEEIAGVDGIDAVFVGRTDLTVSLGGTDALGADVIDTVADVVARVRSASCAVGMFTPDLGEIPRWRAAGASFFLLGSDHGFLRSGAMRLVAEAGLGPSPAITTDPFHPSQTRSAS